MDLKRFFLVTSLIIVGYLIVLQWSRENHHVTQKSNVEHKPQISKKDVKKEIPQLPVYADNQPTQNLDNKDFINVITDTFELKIDPQGGNIVYLSLPLYPQSQENKEPYILLNQDENLTYIAQSGLIGNKGTFGVDFPNHLPEYSTIKKDFKMDKEQNQLIVDLTLQKNNFEITKRYIFTRNSYAIELEYIINNNTMHQWSGAFYAQLKRDNSKDPGLKDSHSTTIHSFLGAAIKTNDKKFKKIDFNDFNKNNLKEKLTGGYIAILQHYFESVWIPNKTETFTYTAQKINDYNIIRFIGSMLKVDAGKTAKIKATLYAGPKIKQSLEKLADGLDLTVDYGYLWFIAAPMFTFLSFLFSILGNWGWAIIILTAFIKLFFYPLSAASYRSMAKMRALQPKMKLLKDRYGNDRQKMSQELMSLYKKEKVNPMGGCLPILVQMPFFIALYEVLMEAVQLRLSPWIFWIHDLSHMDPYFILPIIMGILMFLQQRLSPAPPDPMQAKIMRFMPVIFTIFFLWFPAGLVMYWVTNNLLSIIQQWWITKQYDQKMLKNKYENTKQGIK